MSIYEKTHPVVDIVVLTYNNRKIIEKFLVHCYKSTRDFKLYVVDNNSKDNTVQFLRRKKYKDLTLIENNENRGVAGGRNDGIKAGSSEYCLCIDDDQFVYPGWLEELFAIHHFGYSIVGVDAWQMHLPSYKMRPYWPKKRCETKFERFSYIGGGGTLVPRKLFEEVNYFDEYFIPMYWEDSDFYFAITQKGYNGAWNYGHKIAHLGHQTIGKDSSKSKYFQKGYKYFVKKWMPYFPLPGNPLLLERALPEIFLRKK